MKTIIYEKTLNEKVKEMTRRIARENGCKCEEIEEDSFKATKEDLK